MKNLFQSSTSGKDWVKRIMCLLFLTFTALGCDVCGIMGSHELGNRLVLLEGDKLEDQLIVFCTNDDGCCNGGMPIIPSSEYINVRYVEKAIANENWVIVKAFNKDDSDSYWIIDKGFVIEAENCDNLDCKGIIQANITGPFDDASLKAKLDELDIDLVFR